MTNPYTTTTTARSQTHLLQTVVSHDAWFDMYKKLPRRGAVSALIAQLFKKLHQLVLDANLPDNHPDNDARVLALIESISGGDRRDGLLRDNGSAACTDVRAASPGSDPNLPGGAHDPNSARSQSKKKVGGAVRKEPKKGQGAVGHE